MNGSGKQLKDFFRSTDLLATHFQNLAGSKKAQTVKVLPLTSKRSLTLTVTPNGTLTSAAIFRIATIESHPQSRSLQQNFVNFDDCSCVIVK